MMSQDLIDFVMWYHFGVLAAEADFEGALLYEQLGRGDMANSKLQQALKQEAELSWPN